MNTHSFSRPAARVSSSMISAEIFSGTAEIRNRPRSSPRRSSQPAAKPSPTHTPVATPEGGEELVRTALDTFGRIDIIVNNAGVQSSAPLESMTPHLLDAVLDVNLKGPVNVLRPAWQRMIDQRYGRMINTASIAGYVGAA